MFKRIIFFILLICSTIHSLHAKGDSCNISIAFIGSLKMDYRSMVANDDYAYPIIVDIWNDLEVPKTGYRFGVLIAIPVHQKIAVRSGVVFSNNGFRFKKQALTFDDQFNGTGFDPPSEGDPTHRADIENLYYMDIPLQVKFTFTVGKIKLYLLPGIEGNVNLFNTHIAKTWYKGEGKEREKSDSFFTPATNAEIRTFNFTATIAVGVEIPITEKLSIPIQPTFRYMVLPVAKNAPLNRRLYDVGITTGLTLKL